MALLVLLSSVLMQGAGTISINDNHTNDVITDENTSKPFYCEGKEEWMQYNGNCYQAFTEPLSFLDAEDRCVEAGAHLTSIGSSEENILCQPCWGTMMDGSGEYLYYLSGSWVE
eukprot:TRINITY_DN19525_c0_g1_i1.p1 TRINITY_DN19525_c0_g1~~TRINITY_DN19525_c0_g1_i1.p1  ORF type:complete len:114 (-),score=20.26 TRINITY_DN19525_c0_g1_i1:41-382(-)